MQMMARYPDKYFELAIVLKESKQSFADKCRGSKVAFPKTNDFNTEFLHISVLGCVQRFALFLSVVEDGKLVGFPVPVVAVKLDSNVSFRDERVNGKLAINDVLRNKDYTNFSQQTIALCFQFVWRHFHLFGVKAYKSRPPVRISISTGGRAIRSIVKFKSGGGYTEKTFANFANQFDFVSSLKRVVAFLATRNSFFRSMLRSIKQSAALNTGFMFTCFIPTCFPVRVVAGGIAKFNTFSAAFSDLFATTDTSKNSYAVFHNAIIA